MKCAHFTCHSCIDIAQRQLDALRWQVENEGCAASHLGETTYECRADAPCGLCRLRSERDAAIKRDASAR